MLFQVHYGGGQKREALQNGLAKKFYKVISRFELGSHGSIPQRARNSALRRVIP